MSNALRFTLQAFVHQHLDQRLISDAFAGSDLARPLQIVFRKANRDLTLLFFAIRSTRRDPAALVPFDFSSSDRRFT